MTSSKKMTNGNEHNVYFGTDSLKKYFNPDCQPPLPLVELPPHLNPYHQDGVRIYAKMMTMHPANNVKAMPALNMLESSVVPGKTDRIIEYSSGSTVISMSMVARVKHGVTDTRAFLSNKTSDAKLKLMQFFGLDITLFGGPSQPEPLDERGGIQSARRMALESETTVNPNQYENKNNWQSHIRWTGPQIFKQLPEINVLCAGMGTSGTMTGLGTYFKDVKPSVYRLGVCTAPGDRVPGPRSYALLRPVEFPWKAAVDSIEEVGSVESYTHSLNLCREGLVCGPSSGFNLQGLFQMLAKRKAAGTLSELAGPDGTTHCVFLCCDLPYQYIDEYFQKLGEQQFHPIRNECLKKVDLHRYDESWERDALEVLPQFYGSPRSLAQSLLSEIVLKPQNRVLDLRQPDDFSAWHLPDSMNLPLSSVGPHSPSPFSDPTVLAAQWVELENIFNDDVLVSDLGRYHVLVVCYDGDSARVATSVLRAKGLEADSVRGGHRALRMCEIGSESPIPTAKGPITGTVSVAAVPLE
ncbi:Tryptophan synthase beta subunit-like PLP-dependent enzymes superfamily [Penicillium italicum]|uniref:Tryptophan synthase beta subunit-like PLP-dependent enzymes superfamily n=1 Tax=Penicillium italicum TaxID=40296 RepID=A0A0A2KVI0_PENIT|nr:Tryptophan synthase beta subunit-like PLP-dependent enzymes superfamily [Penicillium italicum]